MSYPGSGLCRSMLVFLLLLLLLCSSGLSTALAAGSTNSASVLPPSSARTGVALPGHQSAASLASTTCSTLCYYNGPVQHHPKIYLIFWGPEWATDQYGVIPAMVNLFGHLAGGAYNNILAQYYDTSGPIANDTTLEKTSQSTPYYIDNVV